MTETTRYLTLWLAVAVGVAALLTGCKTTTYPDGTVVREYDAQSLEIALQHAEFLLDIWEQRSRDRDDEAYQRELERRRQAVEELREALRAINQR